MNHDWTTHTLLADPDAARSAARGGTDEKNRPHDVSVGNLRPAELLEREWLLTNGTGAYAMGTALGCNTRRYHGLLIAAEHPPVGRVLALNQVFDQLVLTRSNAGPAQSIELSTCLFENQDHQHVFAPQGHETLARFDRGPTVQWTYRFGQITVTRELILHPKTQAATLLYHVEGLKDPTHAAALHVAPMLTLRDFHGLLHSAAPDDFTLSHPKRAPRLTVTHHDHAVTLAVPAHPGATFRPEPDRWHRIAYPRDTHRGQDDHEDYFVPGQFIIPLKKQGKTASASLTVALGTRAADPLIKSSRPARLKKSLAHVPGNDRQQKALALAADDFVVERQTAQKKLTTIMAGYPWFADWGRDTFIALPGLLLATGRHPAARDVLQVFAASIQDGLVPNRFDDYTNQPHYNTVDASMWFVHAALEYAHATQTAPAWLRTACTQVLDAYAQGTQAHGHDGRPLPIRMDADGLITAGDHHAQLTWMDAACGDTVFTPRPGKCVEINALWFSNLTGLADLLADRPRDADRFAKLAVRVKRSFNQIFWSEDWQRLIDHVTPVGDVDPALRPNQVIACALARTPLSLAKRKAVLKAVGGALLTPMGLRTLPPDDPNYHPHYGGPQFDRDRAYHQGTVWPWLIGPYAEAILRVGRFSKKARIQAAAAVQPLLNRLMDEGLGQLAEIHDADPRPAPESAGQPPEGQPPSHAARGCPAQAWSVAEVLRVLALIED
ncbi:MAG: amylo-alpha-1,6-glucosidase [Planctomycetota bacterium]